jgi:hypothetical protein
LIRELKGNRLTAHLKFGRVDLPCQLAASFRDDGTACPVSTETAFPFSILRQEVTQASAR